jgi:hypothetical protein
MAFFLNRSWIVLLPCVLSFSPVAGEEADPADSWARAYSWLQTGERLSKSEQLSLAMGSYIESHRQMKEIQQSHPSFEPELVSYRVERLEEMIAETQGKLPPGGQAITTKFLDFIESYDLGMKQRFANQFVEALNTLDVARVILDEIIFENPEEFREAVDTQYEFLHSSLGWLDQQINYKQRTRRATYVSAGAEWGTTEFVKASDLPGEGDSVLTSAALFPGLPSPEQIRDLQTIPGADTKGDKDAVPSEEAKEVSGAGVPGFRMSSKQKEVPKIEITPVESEKP